MPNGTGVYLKKNVKVEGNWLDDQLHGFAKESLENQYEYEGYYRLGIKEGYGIYIWKDGSMYLGMWANNSLNGFGVYKWSNGKVFLK